MALVSQNKLLVPGNGLTGTQSLLPVPPVEPMERPAASPVAGTTISPEG